MNKLASALVISVACLSSANASQLIANGGFETGNFSGWSAGSTQTSPFQASLFTNGVSAVANNDSNSAAAWFIKNTNSPYFGSASPTVATPITGYSAFNGFDGSPGYFYLEQGFNLLGTTATADLGFDWGIQSNYSGQSRVFSVNLLDFSHQLVSSVFSYSRPTGYLPNWTVTNTALDLDSLFSTLNPGSYFLQFRIDIPQNYTGPAQFALDNISLNVTQSVPEPASLALLGVGIAGLGVMRRKQKSG